MDPKDARVTLPAAGYGANLGTIPMTGSEYERARAVPPDEAYRLAIGAARVLPAPAGVGYRLFWVRGASCGCVEAPAELGKHVVIGRHDHCDIVLDDERTVSLRHVMVRVSGASEPVINILDLRTSDGFELADGSMQRCVVATGPLWFRVGKYAIVALPNGAPIEDALPAPVVDCADTDPYVLAPEAIAPKVERGTCSPTRITSLPMPSAFTDIATSGEAGPSTAAHYELRLELGVHRAAIRFAARDIEHGVLIGRDEKCADAGLHAILRQANILSRVHCLVIRNTEGVFMFDAGSTNGIVTRNGRVRCVPLSDEGTVVYLPATSTDHITFAWRAG